MTVLATEFTQDLFNQRVIDWWHHHGRKDLPWQRSVTPYRVWVSEVMLQQTQVNTVIGYFDRFMERFPSIGALADASIDAVLELWTGLGYYARARNLHRAAKEAVNRYGDLPKDLEALIALPGIGRSTAGAIMSLAHGISEPILDGNVKRVLARHAGIEGWVGRNDVQRKLWALAGEHTPTKQADVYTQAIMDLGATVCTRRHPDCDHCPVEVDCLARIEGRQSDLPTPKPNKKLPEHDAWMLFLQDQGGAVLLERRPSQGIWGGLWSLPEVAGPCEAEAYICDFVNKKITLKQASKPIRHTFTHFRLNIHLLRGYLKSPVVSGVKDTLRVWYKPGQQPPGGMPAPVVTLLKEPNPQGSSD
ncbi:A/G-specific adenine glycosylase [Acidihalobacter prosperus]